MRDKKQMEDLKSAILQGQRSAEHKPLFTSRAQRGMQQSQSMPSKLVLTETNAAEQPLVAKQRGRKTIAAKDSKEEQDIYTKTNNPRAET